MGTKIQVLNKGYVELIDHMGSDLSVVNAARVSFGKVKTIFDDSDEKLIRYLAAHEHTSPFRHTSLTFHVKAPIFVFRQWMKHRIGSEFNEISGRYVEFPEDDFYVPEIFRKQSENNKQGSYGMIDHQSSAQEAFLESMNASVTRYKELISLGVCKEQARCVLPVGMYSEVYWTVSLQAAAHFIRLREEAHAQYEIQLYAAAVKEIVSTLFPVSIKYLLQNETK